MRNAESEKIDREIAWRGDAEMRRFVNPINSRNSINSRTAALIASNLKLAPWNHKLGNIGRVVDEENTPVGKGDHTSCIPQGEAILKPQTILRYALCAMRFAVFTATLQNRSTFNFAMRYALCAMRHRRGRSWTGSSSKQNLRKKKKQGLTSL